VSEPASRDSICPTCEEPVDAQDRFCERCGAALGGAEVPADGPALRAAPAAGVEPGSGRVWGPSTAVVTARNRGSTQRVERVRASADHEERDLIVAAAVSDRGYRHEHNEDAFTLSAAGNRVAAVVCDGVSTTASPGRASAAAARAAMSVLEAVLVADDWPTPAEVEDLLDRALGEACRAVARVPVAPGIDNSQLPSTTIVAALVGEGGATVASVGDSRAYWLSDQPGASRQLTVDDSWAEEAIAAGMAPAEAHRHAQAHVITGWLAADVEELTWHVGRVDPPAVGGVLLVCTDGLWNDLDTPDALLAPLAPFRKRPRDGSGSNADEPVELVELAPLAVARTLVAAALEAGGHDNVTVAVIPLAAAPETPDTSQPTIPLPDGRPLVGPRPPVHSRPSSSPAPEAPA
jgi:serine/threonine protein phosphatase PrpC